MATKNQNNQTIVLCVCQVARTKDEVLAIVEEQILKGNEILNQYPVSYEDAYGMPLISKQLAQKFYAEHRAWKEYSEEIYTSSFSDPNTKYLHQFIEAGTFHCIIEGDKDVYEYTRYYFQKEINELESFKQRLDLIYPVEMLHKK